MPILLTVLWRVRFDMHQYGDHFWMRLQDVRLDSTCDSMTFGDSGAFSNLQVEVDLEAVA